MSTTVMESFYPQLKEANERLNEIIKADFEKLCNGLMSNEEQLARRKIFQSIQSRQSPFYKFIPALQNLYDIMLEKDVDFFRPVFEAATAVIKNPNESNKENLKIQVNSFKEEIIAYKKAHPFSTGMGFIVSCSLVGILGFSLMMAGAMLGTGGALALPLAASIMEVTGFVTTLVAAGILSDQAANQYKFFNNTYQNVIENSVEPLLDESFHI